MNLLSNLFISHEMTKMWPHIHVPTLNAPCTKNASKLLPVKQVTEVSKCESSLMCKSG